MLLVKAMKQKDLFQDYVETEHVSYMIDSKKHEQGLLFSTNLPTRIIPKLKDNFSEKLGLCDKCAEICDQSTHAHPIHINYDFYTCGKDETNKFCPVLLHDALMQWHGKVSWEVSELR